MLLRLPRIQEGVKNMSMTPEQLLDMIKRADDPTVPDEIKQADLVLLDAESDQILAACGANVDEFVRQIKVIAGTGVNPEKSMCLLATYLYVSGISCGQIHNMFVVAMHKLAGILPNPQKEDSR